MSSPLPSLSIAIVGAGPGGLTLARILQRNGINPTVFERENSLNERSQGGSLDLHPESGLQAMRDAGLMKEFVVHARYEGAEMKIQDKTGKVHFHMEAPPSADPHSNVKPEDDPHSRPEIDREDLRTVLRDSLAKDTIQWGRTVQSITTSDIDNRHTLIFNDASTETYDLIIGADGTWSRVRPLLTTNEPVYSGITFIEATISDIDNRFPALSASAGLGLLITTAPGKCIIIQRQSHAVLRIYAAVRVPESWSASFTPTKATVLGLFNDGWSPDILEFLRSVDEASVVMRKINALPVPTTWEAHPGVTLIGDAAHVVSPFAGEGVNQAMHDGNELAHAITDAVSGKCTLSEAVRQYEEKMFKRGAEVGKESAENLDMFFSEDTPKGVAAKMVYLVSQGPPP
ncbi:putative oxidoreductase [Rhodocollybia butyracea]|uniref:Oxidoreductase n=1 Tax=Rhodocollybia butyracea TaxID=206335 RepID=A0A9P5U221_9AGAR|nr:putative oxidoreductase [Rhodocollybia butyracea]